MKNGLVFRPEFRVTLPALPKIKQVDVIRFDIHETLNDGFKGDLEIVSHSALDTAALLDTDFGLHIAVDGRQRFIRGFIEAILERPSGFHRFSYILRVRDPLFRLSLRHESRIYQVLNTPEIIDKILKDHAIEHVEWRLKNVPYRREYTVQYDETALAFIQRLLFEDGINYHYETDADMTTLVFCDHNEGFSAIGSDPVLPLNDMSGTTMMRAFHVDQFCYERKLGTTSVTHAYYAPESQDKHLMYTTADADSAGETRDYTAYEYQGRQEFRELLNEDSDLDEWAMHKMRLRLLAERMNTETAQGATNCPEMVTGCFFDLSDHPDASRNEALVLQHVHHSGVQASALEEDAADEGENYYIANFHAIPMRLPVVPWVVRKAAPFDGVHMAKVFGPKGWKGVYTDEIGRIKVRFVWDTIGPEDGNEPSCWIVPSQANAGNESGSVELPHINDVVLVGYLRGDLEQPYIMGAFQDGRFIRERYQKAMDKISVQGAPFNINPTKEGKEERTHKTDGKTNNETAEKNNSDGDGEASTAELTEFFGGA